VPWKLIGRRLEVRETKDRVEIFEGPRQVASHAKELDRLDRRVTLPEHRPPRGQGRAHNQPLPEEEEIVRIEPQLGQYLTGLKNRSAGRWSLVLRRLLAMVRDYPRPALLHAIQTAQAFGLYDLDRLERMILKQIAQDYFVLRTDDDDER
jgi:hypothetical protein